MKGSGDLPFTGAELFLIRTMKMEIMHWGLKFSGAGRELEGGGLSSADLFSAFSSSYILVGILIMLASSP